MAACRRHTWRVYDVRYVPTEERWGDTVAYQTVWCEKCGCIGERHVKKNGKKVWALFSNGDRAIYVPKNIGGLGYREPKRDKQTTPNLDDVFMLDEEQEEEVKE